MNENFIVGDIVKSLSGHDKDRLFIVIGIDNLNKIAIIDGRYRGREKPKTKNAKHLVKIAHSDELIEKINSKLTTDAEINKMIKSFKNKEE